MEILSQASVCSYFSSCDLHAPISSSVYPLTYSPTTHPSDVNPPCTNLSYHPFTHNSIHSPIHPSIHPKNLLSLCPISPYLTFLSNTCPLALPSSYLPIYIGFHSPIYSHTHPSIPPTIHSFVHHFIHLAIICPSITQLTLHAI